MQTNIPEEILNMTLEELLLNTQTSYQKYIVVKIYNALKYRSIITRSINNVGDLIKYSQFDLLARPGIGNKTLAALLDILGQYNITLRLRDNPHNPFTKIDSNHCLYKPKLHEKNSNEFSEVSHEQ